MADLEYATLNADDRHNLPHTSEGLSASITGNICGAAEVCQRSFESCIENPALENLAAFFHSSYGEFNIWCFGIRATASGKSSLDYRLRNHVDAQEEIRGLLLDLAKSIMSCEQRAVLMKVSDDKVESSKTSSPSTASMSEPSWCESSDGPDHDDSSLKIIPDDPDVSMVENMGYITVILGQLTRISLAIRKAGSKHRFDKADRTFDESNFKDLKSALTTIILRATPELEDRSLDFDERMKRASNFKRLTDVQRRIVSNVLLRRNRIEYILALRRRSSNRTPKPLVSNDAARYPVAASSLSPGTQIVTLRSAKGAPRREVPGEKTQSKPFMTKVPSTVRTATAVESLDLKHMLSKQPRSAVTNITAIGKDQSYPKCPALDEDSRLYCPYCDDLLPSIWARKDKVNNWKAHVMQDLLPYSCFFDDCNMPEETFLTAEKLLAHVLERHAETSWICDSCIPDHRNELDFNTEVFHSAIQWLSHQREVHDARIPDEEADLLAQVGERRLIRMPGCPICSHTSGGSMYPHLDEHILAHIHEFSLWALPENQLIVSEAGSSKPQVILENETADASELQPLRYEINAVAVHVQLITDLDVYRYCGSSVDCILSDLRQLQLSAAKSVSAAGHLESCLMRTQAFVEAGANNETLTKDERSYNPYLLEASYSMIDGLTETIKEAANSVEFAPFHLQSKFEGRYIVVDRPAMVGLVEDCKDLLKNLDDSCFQRPTSSLTWREIKGRYQSRVMILGHSDLINTTIAFRFTELVRLERDQYSIFWVDASSIQSIQSSYAQILARLQMTVFDDPEQIWQALAFTLNAVYSHRWVMIFANLQQSVLVDLVIRGWLPGSLSGHLIFVTTQSLCQSLLGRTKVVPLPQLTILQQPSILIPFSRDPDFVDRTDLMDDLYQKFSAPTSRVALVGLGGIGKSQIAIEFAYRMREKSPETWVFWVNASNAARLIQGFCDIADHLKLTGRHEPDTDVPRLVQDWMRSGEHQWLLMLDDVGDASFLLSSAGQQPDRSLIEYISHSERGSILITTRNRSSAMHLVKPQDVILVDPMTSGEAAELLEKKLGGGDGGDDESQLLSALGYLPLAVVQAASYISARAPRYTAAKFLHDFRESGKQLSLINYEASHLRRDKDAKNSIGAIWEETFEHLWHTKESAAELLYLISFFDKSGIPKAMLYIMYKHRNTLSPMTQFGASLGETERPYQSTEQIALEDVKTHIERLEQKLLIDLKLNRERGRRAREPNSYEEADKGDAELSGKGAIANAEQQKEKEERKIVPVKAERKHDEEDAKRRQGLQVPQADVSDDEPEVDRSQFEDDITVLSNYSLVTTESEGGSLGIHAVIQKAIHTRLKANGELERWYSPFVSSLCGEFHARMLDSWNGCQELIVHVEQSALLQPSSDGTLHEWALLLHDAAIYALRESKAFEAKMFALKATTVRSEVLGMNHEDTLGSMSVLAAVYTLENQLEEADALLEHVVELHEESSGTDHRGSKGKQESLKEVTELLVSVREMREAKLGSTHPDTLASMKSLAFVYDKQGLLIEAVNLHESILEIRRRTLGEESPITLSDMHDVALLWRKQSRNEDATRLLRHCVELSKAILGADYPGVAFYSTLLKSWETVARMESSRSPHSHAPHVPSADFEWKKLRALRDSHRSRVDYYKMESSHAADADSKSRYEKKLREYQHLLVVAELRCDAKKLELDRNVRAAADLRRKADEEERAWTGLKGEQRPTGVLVPRLVVHSPSRTK